MTPLHHCHATLSVVLLAILLTLYFKLICWKTNLITFKPGKTLNQDQLKAQKMVSHLCDHMESSYTSTYLLPKFLTSTLYCHHSRNLWANFLRWLKTETAYVKNQWQVPLYQASPKPSICKMRTKGHAIHSKPILDQYSKTLQFTLKMNSLDYLLFNCLKVYDNWIFTHAPTLYQILPGLNILSLGAPISIMYNHTNHNESVKWIMSTTSHHITIHLVLTYRFHIHNVLRNREWIWNRALHLTLWS